MKEKSVTTLTDTLLDPILAADPAGPRITWYDDGTGARITSLPAAVTGAPTFHASSANPPGMPPP